MALCLQFAIARVAENTPQHIGFMLSVSSLLLEELSFHIYPKPRQLAILLVMVIVENPGYRQLNSLWRLWGLLLWAFGSKGHWSEMTRTANWQSKT